MSDCWPNNAIQFPRLLAEINAIGLTPDQLQELCLNTGLSSEEINDVFERAEQEFRALKDGLLTTALARGDAEGRKTIQEGRHESSMP